MCYLHSHWWRKEGVWTIGIDKAVSGEVAKKVDRILAAVLAGQS
jgi:hypothetical protein